MSHGGLSTIASKLSRFSRTYSKKFSQSITFKKPKEHERCSVARRLDIVPCKTIFPAKLENKSRPKSVFEGNFAMSQKVLKVVSQLDLLSVFLFFTCEKACCKVNAVSTQTSSLLVWPFHLNISKFLK